MTQQLRDLMAAIRATPDDGAPREVLADFYEEQGDSARADFVRAQVRQLAVPRLDPAWLDHELAARAPMLAHGDAWRAALPSIEGVRWGSFVGGIVGSVAFDDVALVPTHAETIMAANPVRTFAIRWPRMGDRPELDAVDGLRELVVVGTLLAAEDLEWLARCPILSTVQSLRIVGSRMGSDALPSLLASPHLDNLRHLGLSRHHLDDAAIDALVDADLTLHGLDLSVETMEEIGSGGRDEDNLERDGMTRLAAWPGLANVEALNLTGIQMTPEGLAALLSSPHNGKLRSLSLRSVSDYDWEEDDRPDVLAGFSAAREGLMLSALDIGENQLSPDSAGAIRDCPALAKLEALAVPMFREYESDALQTILFAPWMDSVRELVLDDNGLDVLQIVINRRPKHLLRLSAVSQFPWSEMNGLVDAIAEGPALASLQSLDLKGCAVQDDALEKLGGVDTLPALLELRLGESEWHEATHYTDAGVKAFLDTPLGKRLRSFVADLGPTYDRLPRPEAHVVLGDLDTGHVAL